jgi:putative ABC transport system ATP-binding protein
MNALLESRELKKEYPLGKRNSVPVLKGVDLRIDQGEFLSVMGPSGSGKSTLLYTVSGMDRVSSGSVRFKDCELNTLSEKQLARVRLREMGFVFQQIHLLRNLNVRDNILLSGYLAERQNRSAVDRRARELMERTGIGHLAGNAITQASGGQLQRVGICRALINNPDIIFGDEPTGALDSKSAGEILDLLASINATGTTVMLVTHDIRVASRTHRVLFMIDGRITAEKHLGPLRGDAEDRRRREEELAGWLLEQGL